jgi:hypothetical protein
MTLQRGPFRFSTRSFQTLLSPFETFSLVELGELRSRAQSNLSASLFFSLMCRLCLLRSCYKEDSTSEASRKCGNGQVDHLES